MTVGFVGAGKTGFTLGRYCVSRGVAVAGYYSRSPQSAREAAEFTGSRRFAELDRLAAACDIIFLTVPDDQLSVSWQSLSRLPLGGKSIVHCSGSVSAGIFDGIGETGACGSSLHPMIAIHDRYRSWEGMSSACFTFESLGEPDPAMLGLLDMLGNSWSAISGEVKARYHAACVAVSNLVVGLARTGEKLLEDCGLDSGFAQHAWHRLFRGSADAVLNAGIHSALTGPVERGDAQTVRRHLAVLEGDAREAYRVLSRMLVEVAEEKHPERDYADVAKELSV